MRLRTITGDDPEYAMEAATRDAVRAAFCAEELGYGEEIELDDGPSGLRLTAVSISGPFARHSGPGEFLLALADDEAQYSEATECRFTREAVLSFFERYLLQT